MSSRPPAESLNTQRRVIKDLDMDPNTNGEDIQSAPRKTRLKIRLPRDVTKLLPPKHDALSATEAGLALLFPRDRFVCLEAPLLETADRELDASSYQTTVNMTDCRIYMESEGRIRKLPSRVIKEKPKRPMPLDLARKSSLNDTFHKYSGDMCKQSLNPGYILDAYGSPSTRVAYAVGRLTSVTHRTTQHDGEEVAESVVGSQLGPYFIIGFCIIHGNKTPQKATHADLEPYVEEDLFRGKRAADLNIAYVHSLCSSFRIGRHLLTAVESRLRAEGYDGVMLDSVAKAYSFYARQGYVLHDVYDKATYAFKLKRNTRGQDGVAPYPLFVDDYISKANTFFMLKSFRADSNLSMDNEQHKTI